MNALRAKASLSLLTGADGGLTSPLPTGTRSLLLRFPSGIDLSPEVVIGAVIVPMEGRSLRPGDQDLEAELVFWADEAEVFVTVGASFELWYGRPVGNGLIREVMRDRS
jgi:hypothetical protein